MSTRARVVCVVLLLLSPVPGFAQMAPDAAAAAIVKTSGPSMLVVARLMTEDTWHPLLDQRVQESPSGKALGPAWTPSDARWQKARAALGARMTRILSAYAASNELSSHVQKQVTQIGPGANLDAAVAALKGPAGAAVVHQEAKKTYIVASGSSKPNGPAIGSREWNAQIGELGKQFDARAGSAVPADDGHAAELEKIITGPAGTTLTRIFDFAVSNATRQLNTALNLMMFDERDAIEREIAAATGAKPAADTFSLERMATCKDSWLEWGDDEARVGSFRAGFTAQFTQKEGDDFFVPIKPVTLMGLKVVRVYSSTIGMARGFSVTVDAPFEAAKKSVEQSVGQPLKHCETSDGMRTCDLSLAEKKTVMLMADATGREKSTLVGCFYFYEK